MATWRYREDFHFETFLKILEAMCPFFGFGDWDSIFDVLIHITPLSVEKI